MNTDWEQHYQDQFTPWDKGAPAPPFLDWMTRNPDALSGRILVPGCGLGHDVRAIASSCPEAEVIGIDISPTALAEAEKLRSESKEIYKDWDLFNLPSTELESFDWVWEHTCFCAIDPDRRDEYVTAIHSALKPSGQLLAVFYLNPYDKEHQPGGRPPHGTSVEELEMHFVESGKFRKLEGYVPKKTYKGREGLEWMMHLVSVPSPE